ncbi:hypothetical protein [Flagellimonas aurea]|nr:hypothetical protein [Allomuricauda aurea]
METIDYTVCHEQIARLKKNYNRQKKEMPYIKYSELEATGIT